jgi:hypothetical protein
MSKNMIIVLSIVTIGVCNGYCNNPSDIIPTSANHKSQNELIASKDLAMANTLALAENEIKKCIREFSIANSRHRQNLEDGEMYGAMLTFWPKNEAPVRGKRVYEQIIKDEPKLREERNKQLKTLERTLMNFFKQIPVNEPIAPANILSIKRIINAAEQYEKQYSQAVLGEMSLLLKRITGY